MGLNATFATTIARPGTVAFISQSGALCTAVLDWSLKENVGFSAFVSIGSMLDVSWGDLIDYFGNDPRTNSIVIYMESIGDARSFLSAAREVSLTKPIIVIKAGRTAAAAKAAASHTGSLTGSDEVLEAAFRRAGVLRVNSIADIFYMTEVLAKQPRPKGNRLCIVTNAGGPGVLATDALILGGGELAELSPETMEAFNQLLPPPGATTTRWTSSATPSRNATPSRSKSPPRIPASMACWSSDSARHDQSDADRRTAAPVRQESGQTGIGQLDGRQRRSSRRGNSQPGGHSDLRLPGYGDRAPSTTCGSTRTTCKGIYETPQLGSADGGPDRAKAAEIITSVRNSGRTILTEYESKKLLEAYCIPTVPTEIALSKQEAIAIANTMGYPDRAEAALADHQP